MVPPKDQSAATPLVWFTGFSGAGKSTLACAVLRQLQARGVAAELLDADEVRKSLSAGLGYTRQDREENVHRLGFMAGLLTRHGVVTLVAAMSPYLAGRNAVRMRAGCFVEVFVDAPLALCEERDPVGLYRKFRRGQVRHVSGLDEPYEPPPHPEVHCRTGEDSLAVSTAQVMRFLDPLLAQRGQSG